MKIKMLSRVVHQPMLAFVFLILIGVANARADYTNTVSMILRLPITRWELVTIAARWPQIYAATPITAPT